MIPRPRTSRRPEQPSPRQLLRGALFALSTALALSLLLVANLLPRAYEYREGEVSQTNIRSPRKLTFISQLRTRAERERASAAVPEVLEIDVGLLARQRQGLSSLLQSIAATRSATRFDQRAEAIKPLVQPPFTDGEAALMSRLEDPRMALVFQESQRLLLEAMRERVSEARAQELIRQLPSMASEQLNEQERTLAVGLASRFIRSNLVVNQERTAQLREDARQAVAPVQVSVENGEIVLREGQVVTAADLEKLEMLGLRNPAIDWHGGAASVLLAFVLVAVLSGYVLTFQPNLLARDKRLLLLSLIMIVVVLAAKVVIPARPLWIYVFPLPAVAMLLATLLDARLGIFLSAVLAFIVAHIGGGTLEYAAMFVAACTAAATVVWRRERAPAFFVAGFVAAVAQFGTVLAFMLMNRTDDWSLVMLIGFECIVNGLGSAILAAGGGMLVGRMFGITTTWQLLELANPTHPLLRRLMNEAPGTYQHSLIVGNLAERSAEEVGADPLLARVASYYHDVGKLRRPYFFVENQAGGINPHDSLDPRQSTRIIMAHVTDGVDLAAQYGLPPRIREMIPQHHGTRLVSFFYQQAQENRDGQGEVDPEDFRYPGPRPQSKEAAIVMMADSVEAAARASRDHTQEALNALVEKIILERLSEGQLDECDLTLRDLQKIKDSFFTLLLAMYHPRIEYPEKVIQPSKESDDAPLSTPVRPALGAPAPAATSGAAAEDSPVTSQL